MPLGVVIWRQTPLTAAVLAGVKDMPSAQEVRFHPTPPHSWRTVARPRHACRQKATPPSLLGSDNGAGGSALLPFYPRSPSN